MIMGTVLEGERGTPSHPSAKEMEGSQITVTLGPTEAPPEQLQQLPPVACLDVSHCCQTKPLGGKRMSHLSIRGSSGLL